MRVPCHLTVLIAVIATSACSDGCKETVAQVPGMEPRALQKRLQAGEPTLVLDTRDREAFEAGHIPGALRVAEDRVEDHITRSRPPRSTTVVTVCYSGNQSLLAARAARSAGHPEVYSLRGGMERWNELGLAVQKSSAAKKDPWP